MSRFFLKWGLQYMLFQHVFGYQAQYNIRQGTYAQSCFLEVLFIQRLESSSTHSSYQTLCHWHIQRPAFFKARYCLGHRNVQHHLEHFNIAMRTYFFLTFASIWPPSSSLSKKTAIYAQSLQSSDDISLC